MSHWNYRAVMFPPLPRGDLSSYFRICEVFYDDDGKPNGWCEADGPGGETVEEINQDLVLMLDALHREVLEFEKEPWMHAPDGPAEDSKPEATGSTPVERTK